AAGDDELALAGHDRVLGGQQLAAQLGPGQPGRHADAAVLFGLAEAELRRTEVLRQRLAVDANLGMPVGLDHLDRHLAADRRDLALEVPDPRLLRVVAGPAAQRGFRDRAGLLLWALGR